MGRDNRGKNGKGHQGTCMKDQQTKPKGNRIEGGRWRRVGRGAWWGENGDDYT